MKRAIIKRLILILLLILAFTPQITLISLLGLLRFSLATAILLTGLHTIVSGSALWVVFKYRHWFFSDRSPRRSRVEQR